MNKIKVQKTIDSFFHIKRKKSTTASSASGENNGCGSATSTVLEELEETDNECKKRKIVTDSIKFENATDVNSCDQEVSACNLGVEENSANISFIKKMTNVMEKEKVSEKTNVADMPSFSYTEEIKNLMHVEWYEQLKDELKKNYFQKMYLKIKEERKTKVIFPPAPLVFNAFLKTPLSKIKVVIVGQDPYHQKGQAMGLCFSVPVGIKIPPSLKNILKEIKQTSNHGDLISWAEQGVFLLNTSLTVEENKPASHKNYGWETFTDKVINIINEKKQNIIFMLWGNFAIKKCAKIDTNKHFILKAGHPSPLSVRHFINCDHFNKCNNILTQKGLTPIKWDLPQ
ncbi:uracil-DNA glycosylase [Plasmodium gonderi]|uniref:Uracil-DNA glycosylase n=1 Tax=Plasmodium gonderi TaxID=77519 RepID=A0A1Y1JKL5_PLAGO|nr:uracil-DNA glycosylase [Plasmodium gonderi]GAW83066.1 uracil-DNA glycosylase [Plasmodium gonderi]